MCLASAIYSQGESWRQELNNMNEPTKEQWQRWYSHKSNKERFIEAEEAREDEMNEDNQN